MSTQQSSVLRFPLQEVGETGSLIFGEASRSPITIPKAFIAKIWEQVDDGVRVAPRGGVEVGGLLVGPKSRESGVVVTGIVPMAIDYQYGPAFRMSASDRAKIGVLVEALQVDPSNAVVGFYRSQTRGIETFRDSDREISDAIQAHTSFGADSFCYFVLAPVSKLEMSVCISMWNGADWDRMQFTLGSNPVSVIQAQSSVARQVGLPAEAQMNRPLEASLFPAFPETLPQLATEHGLALPEPTPLFHAVLNAVRAAVRPSKLLYATVGLLALAAAVGGYRWIVKDHKEAATSSRTQQLPMGFSANREGPVWKLSWDRAAMHLMKPSGAVLIITDGNRKQQLNLASADLSYGTVFYTPQGGDLVFSLQLERDGTTPIEEHIRVLEGRRSVQKSAERGPQTLPNNTVAQAKADLRSSIIPAELPGAIRSGADRDIPANPILNPNPAGAETPGAQGSGPNAPSAISSPPSSAAAPTTPSSAAVPASEKTNYIGPKPVQQVGPQRPPNVNSSGIRLQIHVQIDARGNVTKATAIGVTAANFPLVSVTEQAAQSWQFEPAKMDGRPVPSELDLLFKF